MSFIKFLGTADARFVVMKQLRASGGVWLSVGQTNLYIDPGPGALVRYLSSKPKMDPSTLDGILLTHKHLDHCGDVNVMIEAMTEGGFKKRGVLFAPRDALEEDPVVLKYVMGYVDEIEVLKEGSNIKSETFGFRPRENTSIEWKLMASISRHHPVPFLLSRIQNFFLNFRVSIEGKSWSSMWSG